ncbi:hypothetical protein H6501_05655 [Candidatus Woesearchaeota archaeon]|nr:hypothetical protein [Nanoarchaeota archaeon]MCB9371060.1 hypothetical protein [Candidatus Woesearchaeota archaeon]USN44223.1 MAG: hypothetical protein H6500_00035 [Candidatus Woesearchaeota archaeon]
MVKNLGTILATAALAGTVGLSTPVRASGLEGGIHVPSAPEGATGVQYVKTPLNSATIQKWEQMTCSPDGVYNSGYTGPVPCPDYGYFQGIDENGDTVSGNKGYFKVPTTQDVDPSVCPDGLKAVTPEEVKQWVENGDKNFSCTIFPSEANQYLPKDLNDVSFDGSRVYATLNEKEGTPSMTGASFPNGWENYNGGWWKPIDAARLHVGGCMSGVNLGTVVDSYGNFTTCFADGSYIQNFDLNGSEADICWEGGSGVDNLSIENMAGIKVKNLLGVQNFDENGNWVQTPGAWSWIGKLNIYGPSTGYFKLARFSIEEVNALGIGDSIGVKTREGYSSVSVGKVTGNEQSSGYQAFKPFSQ